MEVNAGMIGTMIHQDEVDNHDVVQTYLSDRIKDWLDLHLGEIQE